MKFSEGHLEAAREKRLLKRFAIVEVTFSFIACLRLIITMNRTVQSKY